MAVGIVGVTAAAVVVSLLFWLSRTLGWVQRRWCDGSRRQNVQEK
jgi:hypothetical protein